MPKPTNIHSEVAAKYGKKKPSRRIHEIIGSMLPPNYYQNDADEARIRAIIAYLDEEYEKNK